MSWRVLAAVVAVSAAAVALAAILSSSGSDNHPTRYLTTHKSVALVERSLADEGVTEGVEIACPPAVPLEKSRIFHCQYLIEGHLGHATLEVASSLGVVLLLGLHDPPH